MSEKKSELLGENFGTASHKLRKSILWNLLVKYNLNICFRCGNIIETIDELSIEHKIPWQSADNPREVFYDLNNIAFSHLTCNIRLGGNRRGRPEDRIVSPDGKSWCSSCREHKSIAEFWVDLRKGKGRGGLRRICKDCDRKRKRR